MTTPHSSKAGQPRPTTDNPDEVFDLVDEQDHVIGQVRRGDAHRNPALLHRSVQVLVFDSAGRMLLQRRSPGKDLFPGYYCASASGHVIAGDDYLATAQRELAEELGVSAPLTALGKALVRSDVETELTALFLAQCDGPFHFDPVETAGGEFFTWTELLASRAKLPMTPALLAALDELERLMADGALALPR
ncbi:MAG TPA: NUDIX domain-containing protein [Ktedonobacterales bacterium]|jgi:isopentenyldiphosphate isomerase